MRTLILLIALLVLKCDQSDADNTADINLDSCLEDNVKFEKLIGAIIQPALKINNVDSDPVLLHNNNTTLPITENCLENCFLMEDCLGFVLYYENSTCYYWPNATLIIIDMVTDVNRYSDGTSINEDWFQKICLNAPVEEEMCCSLWSFETVVGATLLDHNTKSLHDQGLITRRACQEACLNESDFICKSVKFTQLDQEKGHCTLSSSNRFLSNSYRVAKCNEQYSENLCATRKVPEKSDGFCSYNHYQNTIMPKSDAYFEGKTPKECQHFCDTVTDLPCRSYTAIKLENMEKYACYLSSFDTKLLGPKIVKENNGSTYFEKAPCLNVSVECHPSGLVLRYTPERAQFAQLYMQGYSERADCTIKGRGNTELTLNLTFAPNNCGFIMAKEPSNRSFWTGMLIIQYHPLVQTSADRLIKIGCIMGNSTKILVGTGVNITDSFLDSGLSLINSTSIVPLSKVQIHINDYDTKSEVSRSQLGQQLQFVIQAENLPEDRDIWATNLIAMTENGEEKIVLLDEMGCPTDPKIFPALQAIRDSNVKQLTNNFQAFKFAISSVVKFSVMVEICKGKCPQIDCRDDFSQVTRKRRQDEKAQDGFVTQIRKSRNQIPNEDSMPLQYVMLVKNAENVPDYLVFQNVDKISDICLNYYLLISIAIAWIVVQITTIICCVLAARKYKRYHNQMQILHHQSMEALNKNYEFSVPYQFENRHVHWADNESNVEVYP